MTREEFDVYCGTKPGVSHVIQWGDASVWKVGGKIFAICSSWTSAEEKANVTGDFQPISFKCSDLAFQLLPEQEGIIPAPYLARAKWVQLTRPDAMSDDDIKLHLDAAHQIIAAKLTKKLRSELGISL